METNRLLSRWSRLKLNSGQADAEEDQTLSPQSEECPDSRLPVDISSEVDAKVDAEVERDRCAQAAPFVEADSSANRSDADQLAEQSDETGDAESAEIIAKARQAALKKLFFSGEFHEVDPLDDYNMDFTQVASLNPAMAGRLRGWLAGSADEAEIPPAKADEPAVAGLSSGEEAFPQLVPELVPDAVMVPDPAGSAVSSEYAAQEKEKPQNE